MSSDTPSSALPQALLRAHRRSTTMAAQLADSLRRWIASGACQGPDGAFHAWRDAVSGELAFAYPEITGYALTYLAGRDAPRSNEVAAARAAADWLTRRFASGDYSARTGWDRETVYTFDLGMAAAGLLNAGRVFELPDAIEQGLAVAGHLLRQADEEGGIPAIGGAGRTSSDRASSWSTEGRAHQIKLVQALLLAGEHGVAGAADAAGRLVAWGSREQREDGRFVTQPTDDLTMLHPHLYAIEGLWMWAVARDDAEAMERARLALDWVWRQQLETGGFPRYVVTTALDDPDRLGDPPEQMDATAQATRAALLFGRRDEAVAAAVRRLGEVARRDRDGSALVYQPASPQIHLNMWVTMFGAQAVELVAPGAGSFSWRDVV